MEIHASVVCHYWTNHPKVQKRNREFEYALKHTMTVNHGKQQHFVGRDIDEFFSMKENNTPTYQKLKASRTCITLTFICHRIPKDGS